MQLISSLDKRLFYKESKRKRQQNRTEINRKRNDKVSPCGDDEWAIYETKKKDEIKLRFADQVLMIKKNESEIFLSRQTLED